MVERYNLDEAIRKTMYDMANSEENDEAKIKKAQLLNELVKTDVMVEEMAEKERVNDQQAEADKKKARNQFILETAKYGVAIIGIVFQTVISIGMICTMRDIEKDSVVTSKSIPSINKMIDGIGKRFV